MGLAQAAGGDVSGDKRLGIDGREANIGETALIGPACGITQDERENVHADVVVARPPDGTADQESSVAAAEVYHQRGAAGKEGFRVQRAFGWELFEGGSRPAGGV